MSADPRTPRGVRLADLVARADGSPQPNRRVAVPAHVHRSPALTTTLSQQRLVATLVRSTDVRAPATLHRKVQALLAERQRTHSAPEGQP